MLNLIVKKVIIAVMVALTVSIIGFVLLRVSGDLAAAMAGHDASPEEIEAIRIEYGFDRPIIVQYFGWIRNFLAGNFGDSTYFKQPVSGIVFARLPVTLILGFSALVVGCLVAIPIGVGAAVWRNSILDKIALTFSALGQSMPGFWVTLMLVWLFSVTLQWLPVSGSSTPKHYILPIISLAFYLQPILIRLTRAGMIEVLQSDYLRTAQAKGLSPHTVIMKHALRNAIKPVVSISAVQLGHLLSGSVITETIFAINGIGYLAWQSILRGDFMVVQTILVLSSFIYVVITLFADILNAALDPRLRHN